MNNTNLKSYEGIKCLTVASAQVKGGYSYSGVYYYELRLRKKDNRLVWRRGNILTHLVLSIKGGYVTRSIDRAVEQARIESEKTGICLFYYVRNNDELRPDQCWSMNIPVPEYLIVDAMTQKLTGERL
jgi:hypothetical protein